MTAPSDTSPPGRKQSAAAVVMGVSGSGKTAVGEAVAKRLGMHFLEGDSFHPPANVEKMASGTPLTDADRGPWLDAIADAVRRSHGGVVVTCSALKRAYRDRLVRKSGKPILFVFLDGSRETLADRIGGRKGHFMPPSLLASQLAALEPPADDEWSVRVSVEPPLPDVIVDACAAVAAAFSR